MRVAPILSTPAQRPNFKGLLVKAHENSYDDNAQETSVHSIQYLYYPFADEPKENIHKVIEKYTQYELDEKPAPMWNSLYKSTVTIKPTLSITAEEYKKAIVE